MEIRKEKCAYSKFNKDGETIRKIILPDEINDFRTFYIGIKDKIYKHRKGKGTLSIFLLFNGAGLIRENNKEYTTDEIAVFVPSDSKEISFSSKSGILEILEIELKLSDDDLLCLKENQNKLPYFETYSNCPQYREAIKSEKTINRMILPEDIVPRLCIGSVETKGPDKIGEHKHPMLEQMFFGLAHNHCFVKADNQNSIFEENDLLHIPLGAMHGVEVKSNQILHYIWIDYFKSQNDMNYISEQHILND